MEQVLQCSKCEESFPIINGIPRMLISPAREALQRGQASEVVPPYVATAQSFDFEWQHFSEMYDEWKPNFLAYMAPHAPDFFEGKRVLDVGCGSGRHAYYAAKYGSDVWAVDLGSSVEVARRNTSTCDDVHVVQADLLQLPFEPESFDFVYAIGVLHHLENPEAAFRTLLRFVKPGGKIHIYLYWRPENQRVKSALLRMVEAVRKLTVRLPHRLLYLVSYPAAWLAFAFFVWPYRLLSRIHALRPFATQIPMRQYADYPFRVCVNDQFDRFSAPIEARYTKAEVEGWFKRGGLSDVIVRANYGWCGTGRKPT